MRAFAVLVAMILYSGALFSQEDGSKPKKIEVGLNVGFNYSLLSVVEKDADFKYSTEITNGAGFSGGLSFVYNINDSWHIKPMVGLLLNNSELRYDFVSRTSSTWIYATSVETTILAEYDLKAQANTPTILFGGSFINLIPGVDEEIPEMNSSAYTLKLGAGFKQFGRLVTWSADLVFSIGLNDLITDNPEIQENAVISSANKHMVGLVIHFY